MYLERKENYREYDVIYSDGSKTEEGVGFAVLFHQKSIKKALPPQTSIYHAELIAVLHALNNFNGMPDKRLLLCTDSMSSIMAIKDQFSKDVLLQQIHSCLGHLKSINTLVTLLWVPSHVGILGNEEVDQMAKEATSMNAEHNSLCHPLDEKRRLKKVIWTKWQQKWNDSNTQLRSIEPSVCPPTVSETLTRREAAVLTRLRIGHTRLTHGHHLVGRGRPTCSHCGDTLTVQHILLECRGLAGLRDKHKITGTLKDLLSWDGKRCRDVLNYVQESKLFYEI